MSVPGPDESWMDGLSAVDVFRQFGFDPNVILTPEGRLKLLDGDEYDPASAEFIENSSVSDDSASDTYQNSRTSTEGRKQLKLKLTTNFEKQAKARERGAIPAFRQRNYDYVKLGMVKCGLLTLDAVATLCPKEKQR